VIIITGQQISTLFRIGWKTLTFFDQIITIVQKGLVIFSAFLKGQHSGADFLCLTENIQSIKKKLFLKVFRIKKTQTFFILAFASDELHVVSQHNNKVRSQGEIICCR